ncbi:MAG: DEAD/DEAH box helicase family protein [Clostridia bacterium]|nr:DEAD/DEAH box helicase family protein [Clostridia bacterium]
MSEVKLFSHNEEGYENLCDTLKNNKCATINRATGTGKSFIALKYLNNNTDKRYLYLAPTYQILDQLDSAARSIGIDTKDLNFDRMIYNTLLGLDMKELFEKYDGFIFDEYHRCGAQETFYKIRELKALLNESKEDKKFIGLTATPIRYLDDERNMTNEIFDGVVASTLTLPEALSEGLLPIPSYYISGSNVLTEYEKAKRKVARLYESSLKGRLERQLDELHIDEKFSNEANSELFSKYLKQDSGKHIIFCKDIETAELVASHLNVWFKKAKDIKPYVVHSDIGKEKSAQILDAFNKEKDGFNVLVCVDLLNEGFHPECGIDSVTLYRRTASPIIYFQQIGRALSFSARKNEVAIFDLVCNFENHKAILEVYDEFQKEMQRKIEEDPDNKKKYESMLKKFRIMDESKKYSNKIKKIVDQIDDKAFIISRIEYAIRILDRYVKANHLNDDFYAEDSNDPEVIDAYYTIEKYYRYVKDEHLAKLSKIKFVLPPILDIPFEERRAFLGDYDCIYEKEKNESIDSIQNIISFINKNKRTPNGDSEDLFERQLYDVYLKTMLRLGDAQRNNLKDAIINAGLKIEPWEKSLLHIKPTGEEIIDLTKEAYSYVKEKKVIPKHIFRALSGLTIRYSISGEQKILEILKASDRIEKEQKIKHDLEQKEIINQVYNICFYSKEPPSDNVFDRIQKLLSKLDEPNIPRFKKAYLKEKKLFIKRNINIRETTDMSSYCKNIKNVEVESFPKLISMLEEDSRLFENLEVVKEYLKTHQDKLPSSKSENEEDRRVSNIINDAISRGLFNSSLFGAGLFRVNTEEPSSTHVLLDQVIKTDGLNAKLKLMIAREVFFVKKNNRRPSLYSPNDEEKKIASDYWNFVLNNLSPHNQLMLSDYISSYRFLKNSIEAEKAFKEGKHNLEIT